MGLGQTSPRLLDLQSRRLTLLCEPEAGALAGAANFSPEQRSGSVSWCKAEGQRELRLRIPELAQFRCSLPDYEIHCSPYAGMQADALTHAYQNLVAPLLAAQAGLTVLHASAVVLEDGRAAAFLGESGRGKSTLAASFVQAGRRLLADDCLQVGLEPDQALGFPSLPGLRLWPAAAEALALAGDRPERADRPASKLWLEMQAACRQPAPIAGLFFLEEGPAVEIRPLAGGEAFLGLFQHAFRLDLKDQARLREEFETLSELAQRGLCFRLAYPRAFARLAEVRGSVEKWMAGV